MTETHTQHGYTLIELIVTIAVLSVVALATLGLLEHASTLRRTIADRYTADSDLSALLARTHSEMASYQVTSNANASTWSFVAGTGVVNEVRMSGSDILWNGRTMVAGAASLNFTYYDSTNGLLSPLPLTASNRALVARIAMDAAVPLLYQTNSLSVNFFVPRQGTIR